MLPSIPAAANQVSTRKRQVLISSDLQITPGLFAEPEEQGHEAVRTGDTVSTERIMGKVWPSHEELCAHRLSLLLQGQRPPAVHNLWPGRHGSHSPVGTGLLCEYRSEQLGENRTPIIFFSPRLSSFKIHLRK